MMVTTHVLAGLLVGLGLAGLSPEGATFVVVAGAAGGLAPDLDALGTHRKDLHFPVLATALAVPVVAVGLVTRWPAVLGAGAFLAAAGLHAASDAFDGGRSLRPWAESVDRAVYCHVQGRWWRPRGLIPYDGSPADLGVAAGLGVLALVFVDGSPLQLFIVGLLGLSVGYALVRKSVPDVVEAVGRRIGRVDPWTPNR